MTYREPLPVDCPPDTAYETTSPRLVYRLRTPHVKQDD